MFYVLGIMVTYELIQDGVVVASVSGSDRDIAFREIQHYAMLYAQDGPVLLRVSEDDA